MIHQYQYQGNQKHELRGATIIFQVCLKDIKEVQDCKFARYSATKKDEYKNDADMDHEKRMNLAL